MAIEARLQPRCRRRGRPGLGSSRPHLAPAIQHRAQPFDAIIVLGSPADSDGNPKDTQQARVTEAVNVIQAGVASHIILTGGASAIRFVERASWPRSAQAQGIPESALLEDTQARDTVENACYSLRIMKDHGWRSGNCQQAYQLPRAGLIFNPSRSSGVRMKHRTVSPQSRYDKPLQASKS